MAVSEEHRRAQTRERVRRHRARKKQFDLDPSCDTELARRVLGIPLDDEPDDEPLPPAPGDWQTSADRSAMPGIKRIIRRPGHAVQVEYESVLTPAPEPEPAPVVNREARLAYWLSRVPPILHGKPTAGQHTVRLAWATQRVAEELGELAVMPKRAGETFEETLARNEAAARQPARGYAIKGFLDRAGKLISRHDQPPMPRDPDWEDRDALGESMDAPADFWGRR
jgi:hypothetical protein